MEFSKQLWVDEDDGDDHEKDDDNDDGLIKAWRGAKS